MLEKMNLRLGLCITMTWAEEMLILLLLAVIGANSESTKKSWKNWVLSLKNIYRGPLGDYDTPKGELGTENGNRGRKW